MTFVEDMSAFFGDLAQAATLVVGTSTSSVRGYFDTPSVAALAGVAMVDDPSFVLPSTVAIRRGATLTIDAEVYTVRAVEKIDDGHLQRAMLESA